MSEHSLQYEIGNKLKYIREVKLNISQKELAEKCNLDPTYISRVENGKQNLTLDSLEQICNALRITIIELLNIEIK